jgi:MFS family permease
MTVVTLGGGDVGAPATTAPPELLSALSLGLGTAGLMLAAALGPVLVERHGLRRATAAVLVVEATILLRIVLAPAPGALEEVLFGILLVGVAAAGALLAVMGYVGPEHRSGLARPGTSLPAEGQPIPGRRPG